MSPSNPNDPAIYGPVNGVFVTLSEFQAWQAATFAADQAAASLQFQQAEQNTGITAPNPYTNVVTSTPAPIPPANPTTGTPSAHEVGLGGDYGGYCSLFPDDPLCNIWGGGGIGVSVGGGGTVVEQPIIIEQGIGGADVNAAIDNGLSSVWSAVVGSLDGVLAAVVGSIQAALTGIGNALKAAYAVLARLSGFILAALNWLLREVVAGILAVLQDIRALFRALYNDLLLPMVQMLGNLRARLLDVYSRFIRPMLIVLQNLQRILGFLAAFHLQFAVKLDAKLADLERRITQPLFYLLSYTNAVANWVNLISTANYLIQSPTWLWSMNAYMGQGLNMQLNAMTPNISASDLAAANQATAQQTQQQSEAAGLAFIQTGTGPYAATSAQSSSDLAAALAQGPF